MGPSISTTPGWVLHPYPPKPTSNFAAVKARRPDPNWLLAILDGRETDIFNITVAIDSKFKRRVPPVLGSDKGEGLRWVFTCVARKGAYSERMDLDISICDENMELLCTAWQFVLVVEAQRKFRGTESNTNL